MVKDALKKLAEDFYQNSDPESSAALDQSSPENDVEAFIEKILESFPLIFVDNSITNPNKMGSQHRRPWVDDSDGRDIRSQGIKLNGQVS